MISQACTVELEKAELGIPAQPLVRAMSGQVIQPSKLESLSQLGENNVYIIELL